MQIKAYACWCHVCGKKYIEQAEFMSGPSHVDGNIGITYQVRACDSHQGTGEIGRAFEHYKRTGRALYQKAVKP